MRCAARKKTVALEGSLQGASVRAKALALGAELVGIAAVERFADAPEGARPSEVLSSAQSVLVLACAMPNSALKAGSDDYTRHRNELAGKLDAMAKTLAKELSAEGHPSKPIASVSSRYVGSLG
jgi:epoxyqueuosine reductase